MARITVEDCLDHVDNRFELVMKASRRARQLARLGREPLVPEENDKATVLALREIAEGLITDEVLDAADRSREDAEARNPFGPNDDDQEGSTVRVGTRDADEADDQPAA